VRELPTGTVTLLFTDIEGSTKLLQELGDRYADALAGHRRVLREAFQSHGGVEVDTQGDSFFYAFAKAKDAAAGAEAAQTALAGGHIRVRMGIHTGEPTLTDEGYVGADVHRAARIMAAGHGGQVLLSQTTRDLLDSMVGRDLGEHRLKDLSVPQRLHQLGEGDFPPLKTLHQTNLPTQPTPLVGRAAELAEAAALLRSHRLLTLVGPGGTGKTRLALQVAADSTDDFEGGVWWVSLAAISHPEHVEPAIAQAVGAEDGLAEQMRSRPLLLLLDNFEHLLGAAPLVAELLREALLLKVLATSRTPLRVAGEQEYPVPPLSDRDAVTLFAERARLVDPAFAPDEHVAEICGRLDRLPLALELAAARVKVLPPAKLVERLERALPLLTAGARDAPERQRTLRATIDWSYELLNEDERHLFARLAVFAGSFSLEAAEEICDATVDLLQGLVDNSLVRQTVDGRFFFLETIREFALECLETTDEHEQRRDRHAAYFAALADCRWREIVTGETGWSEVVDRDHLNLHAAVEWALARGRGSDALAIASGVWPFWLGRGYGPQGRRWLERALELAPPAVTPTRAHALLGFGDIARFQGDRSVSVAAAKEALRLFRALDDPRGAAISLTGLADLALEDGDLARARPLAEESVAMRRRAGGFALGRGLMSVAEIDVAEGDYERARALLEESLVWFRAEWPQSQFIAGVFELLSAVALKQGENEQALELSREAVSLAARSGDEERIAGALHGLAAARSAVGDGEGAARLAGATERIREHLGISRLPTAVPAPERIEPAWSEGRRMTVQEAVEDALTGLD
jgi:predicted ATPase